MFRSSSEDEIAAATAVADAVASYVTLSNDTGGAFRQIRLTLRNCPLTITDALAYASVKLATLPEGYVTLLGGVAKAMTFTTTSAIATTLNSGVSVQWTIGSTPASATTLADSMMNFIPGVNRPVPTFTSSTVINTAPAAVTSALFDIDLLDGSSVALPIYLSVAVLAGGDIDGDATLAVSGTIVLTLACAGDV